MNFKDFCGRLKLHKSDRIFLFVTLCSLIGVLVFAGFKASSYYSSQETNNSQGARYWNWNEL